MSNEQNPPTDFPPIPSEESENPAPIDAVPVDVVVEDFPPIDATPADTTVAPQPDKIQSDKTQEKKDIKAYEHLPHNLEVENALLGALLRNPASFEYVDDILIDEHFYASENQRLYGYIKNISDKGQTANPATLKHVVDRDELLSEMGGFDYLTSLVSNVISVVNVTDYAKTIYDLHLKRQLIIIGEGMANDGYDTTQIEDTAQSQLEKAEQRLYDLAQRGDAERNAVSLNSANQKAIEYIEKAYQRDGGLAGIETGFRDLNNNLGGFHRSDLLILAGRPAMGKTALAINCALRAAKAWSDGVDEKGNPLSNGGKVLFFSLEMSAEQLAGRIISQESGVPGDKMRRGKIDKNEFDQIADAAKQLSSVPLMIDDTPGLTITGLRQRARRLQRRDGLDMIIVDYLQLLSGSPGGNKDTNRTQEVSEITRGLKMVAKDLNVPVIALSQLSRTVESRDPPRPQLADLRESGSIEQDADVVMFIYRPEYYLEKKQPEKKINESDDKFTERVLEYNETLNKARHVAEVIIAKQRHGPTENILLRFDGDTTQFSDLDMQHETPYE